MNDDDVVTLVREQRDTVHSVTPVEQIISRGRARRRRRLTDITRLSFGGVVAATTLALGVSGAFRTAAKLGTIHRAAYTLRHNANGTDTLTLTPGELLNPSQLQSDFAQYGIPANVSSGSYCTSDPAPAGFSQAVTLPGPGSWRVGSGQQPTITIDPSKIPSGTELSIGYFRDASGSASGEQQANMSLINTGSYSCSSTPPDMSKPDTSNEDFGLIYGGPGQPPGS